MMKQLASNVNVRQIQASYSYENFKIVMYNVIISIIKGHNEEHAEDMLFL